VGWERRRRRNRGRVSADAWVYNGFFWWNHRWIPSIGDSIGDSATLLYGYLSLNPLVIPSVKLSDVTTPLHISRQTYTPSAKRSVDTDEIFSSVYTNRFADGSMPSVYTDRFWDEIISVGNYYRRKNSVGNSVGFLQFSGSKHCMRV
jgi:hypothetical protein